MANAKISALPAVTTPVAGVVQIPVVQDGTTKVATAADLRNTPEPFTMTAQPTASVTAPAAGDIKMFARSYAGRVMPEYMHSSGMDCFLQPALFNNNVILWLPASAAVAGTVIGTGFSSSGTASHQALASTNMSTSMSRTRFASATSAGSVSGIRGATAICWRGNAANLGGFFAFFRFFQSANVAATQAFVGLAASTGALAGQPSALTDMIGLGYDTGDSNGGVWQLMMNDASGTATRIAVTGATRDTSTVLDLTLYCPSNSTGITVRVYNQSTQTVLLDNVTYTTDLPTATTFLAPHAQARNGATTSAVQLELNRIYIETDI
jgi:hypothetical protein